MICREYTPEDFQQIKEWGRQWGADYNEDQFPNVGFIVPGVAAYFLYSTDSSVCWLENLVAKRGVDKMTRARAIDLLVDKILAKAKELGFAVAYAATSNVKVAQRAQATGAIVQPLHYLITKDLNQPAHLQ
jgi:hypothetical protein